MPNFVLHRCTIPGCGRPTAKAAGTGFAEHHCRYHVQFKARHGSHWCPTYRATELKPYVTVAKAWLRANREHPAVAMALAWLEGLLANAGRAEMAQDIKRRPAADRAKVAFARLRDAGIKPERVLAIYLGVRALIEDDRGSHRVREFRIVQTAKALHRLASGTHKSWKFDTGKGVVPVRMDVYPKSSGLVLRRIGEAIEECAGNVAGFALEPIIATKQESFGLHASHLPGWEPHWKRQQKGREV
jgi:hypothetical protein